MHFEMLSAICYNLGQSKILSSDNGLVFSTRLDNFLPFLSNLKLLPANSFSLEESNISRLVMG